MTASAVTGPRLRAWLGARSTEAVVFSFAAVLALAHAFDDALLLSGAGVPLFGTRSRWRSRCATVAGIFKFDSLRPGSRAVTAFTFGIFAAVNGGRHAHHMVQEGTTANDITGLMALAAGVVLIGLAAWIPFRIAARAPRAPSSVGDPRRRIPLGLLAAFFFYMPVGMAIVDIHSLHRAVGSPPSADSTLTPHHLRRPRPRGLVQRRRTARRC